MTTAFVTRGGLETLRDVVEFARLARGHHPYNIDRRQKTRLRIFPLRRGLDYEAFNTNAPPMQQLPRRSR